MTSSQKPVDDIICSGVTPFLLFSQYGILYAEHQNIFPFRKLLFYSAQYFPVSEAKPHKPQLHFGLHLGAVCGSCGMRQKRSPPAYHVGFYTVRQWAKHYTASCGSLLIASLNCSTAILESSAACSIVRRPF